MAKLLMSSTRSSILALTSALLTMSALGGTAFADAQQPPAPPAIVESHTGAAGAHHGAPVSVVSEVSRYVIGPFGNVRGFLLKDGTAVMLKGAAGDTMAQAVPVGQSVRVEGWSKAGSKTVMRASVFGQHGLIVSPPAPGARGERGSAAGHEKWAERKAELAKLPDSAASGTVEAVVSGRGGKPSAIVLSDGTSVFLRPGLARAVASRGVLVGDRIESQGKGKAYPRGNSLLASTITFGDGARFEAPAKGDAPSR